MGEQKTQDKASLQWITQNINVIDQFIYLTSTPHVQSCEN